MNRIVPLALGATLSTSLVLGCPAQPPPAAPPAAAQPSPPSAARAPAPSPAPSLGFAVSFPESQSREPLDGRVYVVLSNDDAREPRLQISVGLKTQQIFGVDAEGLAPGKEALIGAKTLGFPRASLADVPAGTYTVQAVLHRYETFHRSDGHTVKLPMDRGEGQHWEEAPGNLYSTPRKITVDPAKPETFRIELDHVIPPIAPPAETKYVKHERIQSALLTKFWGRPMFLGAHVILPEGFDKHPNARYPLVISHGHFMHDIDYFREAPPDPNLKPDYSDRFRLAGYNRIVQESAHQLYKDWTSPKFPRMILIEIQHANPYYDDSYAVNSKNLGPYGDAIMDELIPYLEKKYRAIGQGWARFAYGGSTGGWEALAVQTFYPDRFNGIWAACPDPVDFRDYMTVDVYGHKNAFYTDDYWKKVARPSMRNYLGHVSATIEDASRYELVLGTRGRSGEQLDIWQAVFSPAGADGYPKDIWDKQTGVIDHDVATYWRDHYDLSHILQRDWATLGPKVRGKIHIYVGDMDNFYLNNAVYRIEEFLKKTSNPPYEGEVDYGDRAEHCWNGDHTRPNALSRLRYPQLYFPKIMDRIRKSAPRGSDLKSFQY
ncbi:alpha/beta hydrolase-fold protein [Pendulispora albinea]|uniref:Esterase n=1 Tax=Pendulispora albinea TaxID=2741071 RepID=A0ABZ2LTP1_9BACT